MRNRSALFLALCAGALLGAAGCQPTLGPFARGGAAAKPVPARLPPVARQRPTEYATPEEAIATASRPGNWLYYEDEFLDEARNLRASIYVVEGSRAAKRLHLTLRRGERMRPGYADSNPARKEAGVRLRGAVDLRAEGGGYVISPHRMRGKR